jgi:hypothetical protein
MILLKKILNIIILIINLINKLIYLSIRKCIKNNYKNQNNHSNNNNNNSSSSNYNNNQKKKISHKNWKYKHLLNKKKIKNETSI